MGFDVNVGLKIEEKHVSVALRDVAQKQMAFVVASGLTKVGQVVQKHIQSRLKEVFSSPTQFTQRGVFLERAEKARPVATVYFPSSREREGRDQREYIRPGAQGATARSQKKTEYLLTRMGYLPPGWVTVPGSFFKAGRLDPYGNISGAYYKQMIRGLRIKNTKGPAKPVSAASGKRALAMGVDAEFFAVGTGTNKLGRNGGWLPSGVYKRTGQGGRKLLQYLIFIRRANYKQRLNMRDEAMTAIKNGGEAAFSEALQSIAEQFKAR